MFGSSSLFLCLGVCLVICGICLYLISIKFDEQNEKIKNMFDLIYTITNELQLLKLQQPPPLQQLPNTKTTSTNTDTFSDFADIDITSVGNSSSSTKCVVVDTVIPTYDANLINSTNGKLSGYIKKIVVSDCDDSSSSDAESGDDGEDDDADDEDLDGSDEVDDDSEEDESDTEDEIVELTDINYSKDHSSNHITPNDLSVFELNDLENTINSNDTIPNIQVVDNELIQIHSEEDGDLIKSQSTHSSDIEDSVPSYTIDTEDNTIIEPPIPSTKVNTKTIVVDLDPTQPDYKKMSIHQLRKIAIDKGLITLDSKLKKNDILKMF